MYNTNDKNVISGNYYVSINGKDYLYGPLPEEIISANTDENGYIEGTIKLNLSNIIHSDFEQFLDTLSEALVKNDLLMDISYEVIGLCPEEKNTFYILVRGDATTVLESFRSYDVDKLKIDGIIQNRRYLKKQLIGKKYHITGIVDGTTVKGTIEGETGEFIFTLDSLEYNK